MNKWLEFIIEFMPFMILAVLGGIANLIIKSDEDKQDYTIKFIL